MNKFLIICLTLLLTSCSDILSTETIYECSGKFTKAGRDNEAARLFLKFTKYRSIVSLWGDSDGMLNAEFLTEQTTYIDLYLYTKIYGDQLEVYKDSEFKVPTGTFRLLSNAITLDTYHGLYKGTCTKRK